MSRGVTLRRRLRLLRLFDLIAESIAERRGCPTNQALGKRLGIRAAHASVEVDALEQRGAIAVIREGHIRTVMLALPRDEVVRRLDVENEAPQASAGAISAARQEPAPPQLAVVGHKMAWCDQCDRRVAIEKAASCASAFCSFLVAA